MPRWLHFYEPTWTRIQIFNRITFRMIYLKKHTHVHMNESLSITVKAPLVLKSFYGFHDCISLGKNELPVRLDPNDRGTLEIYIVCDFHLLQSKHLNTPQCFSTSLKSSNAL